MQMSQIPVSSSACYKRSAVPLSLQEHSNQRAIHKVGDPNCDHPVQAANKEQVRKQAIEWLTGNAPKRAADAKLAVYEVLYGPRMPVRETPSRESPIVASIKQGSLVRSPCTTHAICACPCLDDVTRSQQVRCHFRAACCCR